MRGVGPVGNHHIPTSLRSTVVTRFFATTDALTPTGPGLAACRGSLIHVSLTSDHAVSKHLECSHSRDPLPQRCGPYGVRASPGHRRLASTPGRIEFTWWPTGHRVTAWSFSSRCSPPGDIAPMQLRSDTGPTVSARSGTLTPLSLSALRRTMPPLRGLGIRVGGPRALQRGRPYGATLHSGGRSQRYADLPTFGRADVRACGRSDIPKFRRSDVGPAYL
jgi:hypothetical protein